MCIAFLSHHTPHASFPASFLSGSVPTMHWSMSSAWCLLEAMASVVRERTKTELQKARFFSISLDESSDHGIAYLSIHAYVLDSDFKRQHLFLEVCAVEGLGWAELSGSHCPCSLSLSPPPPDLWPHPLCSSPLSS